MVLEPLLEGEGIVTREVVLGEGGNTVGEKGPLRRLEIQQSDPKLVVALPKVSLATLISEQVGVDSGNKGEVGAINLEVEGRKEGISLKDFMVVDENVQSPQGRNHNVTILGSEAEQRVSQAMARRLPLSDGTNFQHS